MDVFSFGIMTAPESIKKLAKHFEFDYHEADYYVLHQANLKMNDMIIRRLKLAMLRASSSNNCITSRFDGWISALSEGHSPERCC